MANRTYEVMYIVDPDTDLERVSKLNEAVGKVIEKEGGKEGSGRKEKVRSQEEGYRQKGVKQEKARGSPGPLTGMGQFTGCKT